MMEKLDFLICSIPRMNLLYPPPAPGLLKSILVASHYSCKTKDFVADFFHSFRNHPEWNKIDNWNALPNFNDPKIEKIISSKVEEWAKEIVEFDSAWVGISIFSYESHKIGKLLTEKIKIINPNQKIFLGGAGITNVRTPYPEELFDQGLIDAYITGEGEQSILELAKGNFDYPGINNRNFVKLEKKHLDSMPTGDYSDYDLTLYGKENLGIYNDLQSLTQTFVESENTLPITGSKGCVRACSYCDVPYLWPKFTHRGGIEVANEIIEKSKKYGVRKFHFTDSLVNGSMKEFRLMCSTLAKYNVDKNANIVWTGQFIFRPNRQHTQEDWDLIAQSGASYLEVGLESGSDEIRFQMGKKLTNDDIEHELGNCRTHKITTFPFFIVGYPTETDQHFYEYKQWFERFKSFAEDKTILSLELGGTLRIQPNTPDFNNLPKMGVEFIKTEHGPQDDLLWWNKNNPTLTLAKRFWRRFTLGKFAIQHGFILPSDKKDLTFLWAKWNQLKDIERKFLDERKN